MRVYVTSKGLGPESVGARVVHIGKSLIGAVNAVGDFRRYRIPIADWPIKHLDSYVAFPLERPAYMKAFYSADGWWYSIVTIDL